MMMFVQFIPVNFSVMFCQIGAIGSNDLNPIWEQSSNTCSLSDKIRQADKLILL